MSRARPAPDAVIAISEFRAHIARVIRRLGRTKRPLVLTQRGKSVVVVLDISVYEVLVEEIQTARDVRAAEEQIDAGMGVPHEEARKHVLKALAH